MYLVIFYSVFCVLYPLSCIAGSTLKRRGWWWMRETNSETREGSKRGRSRHKVDKMEEEEVKLIKMRAERKLMTKRKRRQFGGK